MPKHVVEVQALITYTITDSEEDLKRYHVKNFNEINVMTVAAHDNNVEELLERADNVNVNYGSFQFVLSNVAEPGDDNYIDPRDPNQNVINVHPETRINPTPDLREDAKARQERDEERRINVETEVREEEHRHGKDEKPQGPTTQEEVVEEQRDLTTKDKSRGVNQ
jgi:hypothetical protein